MMRRFCSLLLASMLLPTFAAQGAKSADFASHPPTRSLPVAADRPLTPGAAAYVDPEQGDDSQSGSLDAPWKTIAHAASQAKPGSVIYLRAGVYSEQPVLSLSGSADKPITIRSYPGELAILDGGLPEFRLQPADAWEPVAGGAPGEYRSRQTYPGAQRAAGNFADSMVPLHPYQDGSDARALTEDRPAPPEPPVFYLGPGVWWEKASERFHIRLAPTHIQSFGAGNYRGETDPRRLPLVIAPWTSTPLTLQDAKHLVLQDLVIRGAGENALLVRGCENIRLQGLWIYAANRGLRVETTRGLQLIDSVVRGSMPPWGSRSASKYRTADSHLFVPVGTYDISVEGRQYLQPHCRDFEIAWCEFTDGHDGVYLGGVHGLKFHHNVVDNMNDDGLYLSAWGPPGSKVEIYQNRLSRCLTMFAFGLGRGAESEPGQGVAICRNLIDLRQPVRYGHPASTAPQLTSFGRLCGDHGGPIWDPLNFYQNTVALHGGAFRSYYGGGWGGHLRGSQRRVFNNIFLQEEQLPGLAFEPEADLQVDGNLLWSKAEGHQFQGDFFAKFRESAVFAASKKRYPPGFALHDQFADPQLDSESRLTSRSPAVNAGIRLPAEWPDPLRAKDAGPPDIGALPLGATFDAVGPRRPQ